MPSTDCSDGALPVAEPTLWCAHASKPRRVPGREVHPVRLAGVPALERQVRAEAQRRWRPSAHLLQRDVKSGLSVQKGGQGHVENFKVLLCPAGCGQCPEVEIAGDKGRTGEAGKGAVLKAGEWDVLGGLIQAGPVTKG